MAESTPDSVATSSDKRSQRPTKRRALSPASKQSQQVDALFANPDREINIPSTQQLSKTVNAPPEIVANVQGSSAGAGSGEFHVYKASRRREYERLRLMDEEVEREEKDAEFEKKRDERRKEDEEKLSKNQAKRAKAKARKEKGKKGGEGMDVDGVGKVNGGGDAGVKKKLGATKIAVAGKDAGDEDVNTEGVANGNGEAVEEGGGITFHDDD